jgi:hypothetical protein
MKKYLFTAACVVALVGCTKSNSDRMGSAASRESGSATSSTADTTSIRPHSSNPDNGNTISGSGSIESANSGASVGPLDTPLTTPTTSTNNNSNQGQPKTTPPDSTGDQSNGDLSNRPAGNPGRP